MTGVRMTAENGNDRNGMSKLYLTSCLTQPDEINIKKAIHIL